MADRRYRFESRVGPQQGIYIEFFKICFYQVGHNNHLENFGL
jgi:hypothetical protein